MPTPAPRAVRNPRITYDPLEQNHQEPTLTEALLIRSQKQPRARIVGSARYMLDSRKHTREKKLLLRKPRRRENTLNGVHGNDLRLMGPTRLKRCCARARRGQRCRRPPLTSPDCLALSLGHTARSETAGWTDEWARGAQRGPRPGAGCWVRPLPSAPGSRHIASRAENALFFV